MTKTIKKKIKQPLIRDVLAAAEKMNIAETVADIKAHQKEAAITGLENAETLVSNANEITARAMQTGFHNLHAGVFGGTAVDIFRDMGSKMMASYMGFFNHFIETSKEALECKNSSDIAKLHGRNMQRIMAGYNDKSAQLNKMFLEGRTKSPSVASKRHTA